MSVSASEMRSDEFGFILRDAHDEALRETARKILDRRRRLKLKPVKSKSQVWGVPGLPLPEIDGPYTPLIYLYALADQIKAGKARINDEGIAERFCTRCSDWWPADTKFFTAGFSRVPGLHSWCKACCHDAKRNIDPPVVEGAQREVAPRITPAADDGAHAATSDQASADSPA